MTMMMQFLTKNLLLSSHPHLFQWLHHLSTKPLIQGSTPKPHFIVDYLINSLGLSPDKALRASQHLTHLKSTDRPESVRRFLKTQGFSRDHIKTMVAGHPRLLCASLDKRLQPNMDALRGIALPRPLFTQLVLSEPRTLELHGAATRIQFWRAFFGGDDKKLVRAVKRTWGLVAHGIPSSIAPKLSLLRRLGFSDSVIERMVSLIPLFITSSIQTIEAQVRFSEQLGFDRGSGMFVHGLFAVANMRRETLERKMALLRSFGWSEQDVLQALSKAPTVVCLSEENVRRKMDFLVGEAGCEPSYIALNPILLILSLEKRMRPRRLVYQALKTKGLAGGKAGICSVMLLSEKKFLEKYILPHKHSILEPCEAYIAACCPDLWPGGLKQDIS